MRASPSSNCRGGNLRTAAPTPAAGAAWWAPELQPPGGNDEKLHNSSVWWTCEDAMHNWQHASAAANSSNNTYGKGMANILPCVHQAVMVGSSPERTRGCHKSNS